MQKRTEESYKAAPYSGYKKHVFNSRSEREKSYENPIEFELLVGEGRTLTEENRAQRLEALTKCFYMLKECGLIESKSQYASGILQMYRTPIPVADAAAICCCSRQWFRNLENQGRIKLLRSTNKKLYILPEDVVKILEARI